MPGCTFRHSLCFCYLLNVIFIKKQSGGEIKLLTLRVASWFSKKKKLSALGLFLWHLLSCPGDRQPSLLWNASTQYKKRCTLPELWVELTQGLAERGGYRGERTGAAQDAAKSQTLNMQRWFRMQSAPVFRFAFEASTREWKQFQQDFQYCFIRSFNN